MIRFYLPFLDAYDVLGIACILMLVCLFLRLISDERAPS